jgi:putative membrane protein
MIITHNIKLHAILSGTWQNLLRANMICLIAYLSNEFILKHYFEFPVIIPSLLGTGLAFFIGFNNNQAYDRWWEARKIWGALVNNSRILAQQTIYYIKPTPTFSEDETLKWRRKIVFRHLAFVYELNYYLRNFADFSYQKYLDEEDIAYINKQSNKHNAILSCQTSDLNKLYESGMIDGFKFLELNQTLRLLCDDMGRSERIRNTIFPTTYNYYTKVFIWILIFSITAVLSNSVGIWSLAFGSLIGYIFLTIQVIGQALLNPFEPIPTGIPLDQISRTIEINLLEMLGEKDIPKPVSSIKNEYIM